VIHDAIILVSGLPRSGTSMMMQMLAAGGVPILTDERRSADADNPRGYYEFERVKALASDASWMPEARGKAVKVVSSLLPFLPESPRNCTYALVFMERDIDAVLASQRAMLARNGRTANADADARLRELFARHLAEVDPLLARHPGLSKLRVRYEDAVEAPTMTAERVNTFLGGHLDVVGMARSVDPTLRRQR
jgi:hypothetical protein